MFNPEFGSMGVEETHAIVPTAWDKLRAMRLAIGTDDALYMPKELRRLTRPEIITVACLPSSYSTTGDGKLTRTINPEGECDLLERADGIKWIVQAFPGCNLHVALADDDWAYGFTEHYDPLLVEGQRSKLESYLTYQLAQPVEVSTVTQLASSVGVDYGSVQEELLAKVIEAKSKGLKIFSQLPGWLKAVVSYAENKASQRAAQVGMFEDDDTFVKVAKLQIGIAIQGLILRTLYGEGEALYLGTYGDVGRFKDVETKIMMESQSKFFNNVWGGPKKLPALYCPVGSIDLERLESLALSIAEERETARKPKKAGGVPLNEEHLKEIIRVKRMSKGDYFSDKFHAAACDDF